MPGIAAALELDPYEVPVFVARWGLAADAAPINIQTCGKNLIFKGIGSQGGKQRGLIQLSGLGKCGKMSHWQHLGPAHQCHIVQALPPPFKDLFKGLGGGWVVF